MQKALWYAPETESPHPLLVALHTWSGDYRQKASSLGDTHWAVARGWAVIHPDFRGPNRRPEACGSELAVSDIRDAVVFARRKSRVDRDRIYLVGVSGGGHMALLMAARATGIWAGVSAWCGISDLEAWHEQCQGSRFQRYARNLEAVCGGAPGTSAGVNAEYRQRSPVTWLKMKKPGELPPLDINHGVHDGRSGSVPFTHSLHAFNAAVPAGARLEEREIARFFETREFAGGGDDALRDPLYGEEPLRFRREAGSVRVTIFEGGHEIRHRAALNWLAQQVRGQPPVWRLDPGRIRVMPASFEGRSRH